MEIFCGPQKVLQSCFPKHTEASSGTFRTAEIHEETEKKTKSKHFDIFRDFINNFNFDQTKF